MTATTQDRSTPERAGEALSLPMSAAKLYAGTIAVLNSSGYAAAGSTATGLVPVGRTEEQVDNSAGSAGDLNIGVKSGVFRWGNSSSTDEITIAEIGDRCYIVDNQTVAKTDGSGTRSPAGIIVDVDSLGVWVDMRMHVLATTGLLAANNLSDLGTKATARTNLGGGADKVVLQISDIDLVGANAEVKHVVSPVAGTVAKIYSVLDDALTTGDATLTGKIEGSAITAGAITITQSGSAAGDVDVATPSAANTVAAGEEISITVGGTNDASVLGQVTILITPSA